MHTQNINTTFFTDQLNRKVVLPHAPKRIISLVPSQTELLFDLGLDGEVVGITKFCIHPETWFKTKTRIGGTKNLNFEKIKSLQPDLIIGNKEENEEQQVKQLMNEYPVWMSDIKTFEDALNMIESIGDLVNRKSKAIEIKNQIENNFSQLKLKAKSQKPKAIYCIWYNPIMVAASGTFIDSMLYHCGFENTFANLQRYPSINYDDLKNANPDVILLSSEPFPFKQKHIDELQLICPGAKIMLVDGEYFSWYGSRLINAPAYFEKVRNELTQIKI
ncbi:MAG: helical backbone metal receptor [Bacteroidia bacterium]